MDHALQLGIVTIVGFVLLLVLIIYVKMNAAVAILLSTFFFGIFSGMPLNILASTMLEGVGSTLGNITLLVGLGCILSSLLEVSGGIQALTDLLGRKLGAKGVAWTIGIVGSLIVIPVYFDATLILLMPVALGMARQLKCSSTYYTMPLAAGMVAGSGFIPPATHPLLVATVIGVQLGYVMVAGIIATFFSIIWGMVFTMWIGKYIYAEPPAAIETEEKKQGNNMHPATVILLIVLPLIMILLATVTQNIKDSIVRDIIQFIGTPFVAMTITNLIAIITVKIQCKLDKNMLETVMAKSIQPAGLVLFVIGAGGALSYILQDSGIGELIGNGIVQLGIPIPLMAFLIGALIRGVTGSVPVAMAMTAGIVAAFPELGGMNQVQLAGLTLATCGGATTLCHINSAGFWLAQSLMGTDTAVSLKTWGINESVVGVIGGITGCIIYAFA